MPELGHETDFVAQIVAAPDDDRPRLVYADYLMERGDPHGELIVVQCALARHDATDEDVGDVPRLRVRERALLAAHGGAWTSAAGLADWQGRFRRGFLEDVSFTSGEAFVAQADRLRAKAPLVRVVRLAGGAAHVAMWPGAGVIDGLYAEPDGARAIAGSKYLAGLRRFGLHEASPSMDALAAVADLPQPLVALDLGFDGRLETRAWDLVARLATCPARACLERLRVAKLTTIADLAELGKLRRLRRITLEQAQPSTADIHALAACPLEVLEIAAKLPVPVGGLDIGALLAAAPGLRRLRLVNLGLGDRHAFGIARTPNQLRHLDLARNSITDAGVLAIARSDHLRGLRYLDVNGNRVSDLARGALRDAFPTAHVLLR